MHSRLCVVASAALIRCFLIVALDALVLRVFECMLLQDFLASSASVAGCTSGNQILRGYGRVTYLALGEVLSFNVLFANCTSQWALALYAVLAVVRKCVSVLVFLARVACVASSTS